MRNAKKLITFSSALVGVASISLPMISMTSCSSKGYIIDQKLKSHFVDWYNSISSADWNKNENNELINFYCESEQQAIALYANNRGWFWNEALHKQQEPQNQMVDIPLGNGKKYEVRGSDYKKISTALQRAVFPYNYEVYHGVEYQEDEFYDQLKTYIKYENGKYDYSGIVGQTITSYGFISTSLNREEAFEYCDGWNWNDNSIHLPLKEKVVFIINVPEGTKGAAYLADFLWSGSPNNDNQVLIDKDVQFTITKVGKEGDVNTFYMDMIAKQ